MRRLPAVPVFYVLEFALSMPSFIVIAIYLVQVAHLGPLQLILVGTAMEAAIFLTDIPTGVVADTYSRRLSLVISFVLQGVAWLAIGAFTDFGVILAAWAFWGFGYTFMSGAYEAWITDEVGPDRVGRVLVRGSQISYAGALAGLILSVGLAAVSLRLAIFTGGLLLVASGVFAALAMPETGFKRVPVEERLGAWRDLRATAVNGGRFVRGRPLMLLFLVAMFFVGMSTETMDRLWEAQLLREVGLPGFGDFDPIVWFGLIGAVTLVIGFVVSGVLVKRIDGVTNERLARALFVVTAIEGLALLGFALSGVLALAIGTYWLYRLTRGIRNPIEMTWLNRNIPDSSVRATVISITGQADAIGQVGGGPGLGVIGNVFGLRAALASGAAVMLPALAVFARAVKHHGREPELEQLPSPAPVEV
jgi:DHA3 family tetracycline resistance protein-like MFS transporter